MSIPKSFIEELKSRVDIVSIAEKYLTLKRSGRNYFALCPFHKEKTPSFSINPDIQIFKCFGCGKSGDVITLLMELEGWSYIETLKYLANMAGMTLPDDFNYRESDEFEIVRKCISNAMNIYHKLLFEESGKRAFKYLKDRGIKKETILLFKLGFAPDSWDFILNSLKRKGYSEKIIEKAGLVVKNREGKIYDRFRNRLIIPIFDLSNRVIAFGGRALDDVEPKYLNSPETLLFKKGRTLFGLNITKNKIKSMDYAIVVEGYFDLISIFQNGVENVVAPLGTSLTKEQGRIIGRYTRNVVINFDPDSAGIEATKRAIEIFLENEFNIKVVKLDGGLDPDEYVKKYGVDGYLKKINGSEYFINFLYEHFKEKFGNLPTSKRNARIFEEFLPFLFLVENEVELSSYLSELASKMGVNTDVMVSEFKKRRGRRIYRNENEISKSIKTAEVFNISKPERDLIFFIFKYPEESLKILKDFFYKNETFSQFFQSKIMALVCDSLGKGEEVKIEDIKIQLDKEEDDLVRDIITGVQLKFSKEDFLNCINLLRCRYLESVLDDLKKRIDEAEKSGNDEEVRELFEVQKNILNIMNSLKNFRSRR